MNHKNFRQKDLTAAVVVRMVVAVCFSPSKRHVLFKVLQTGTGAAEIQTGGVALFAQLSPAPRTVCKGGE